MLPLLGNVAIWQQIYFGTSELHAINIVHTREIIIRNPYVNNVILLKSPKKQTKQNVQKSRYDKLKTTYLA
jgi:hypothetical protein